MGLLIFARFPDNHRMHRAACRVSRVAVPFVCFMLLASCGGGGSSSGAPGSTQSGTLEQVAGVTGGTGYNDGPAATATFGFAGSVAVDAAGTIYVADGTMLRAISAGIVTTLAGAPNQRGFADGKGSEARFQSIGDIAIDPQGNVIVADPANSAVRRVTPDGVVTTIAGGTPGYQDGPAAQARFSNPNGVSVDLLGNIDVADTDNCALRRIDPSGVVTTLAGAPAHCRSVDGVSGQGLLVFPRHIAAGAAGDIFVDERTSLRRLDVNGTLFTIAAGQFSNIEGLAIDRQGVLYIADQGSRTISRVGAAEQRATVIAGNSLGAQAVQDGPRDSATFAYPWGIAVAPDGLIVTEGMAAAVRKVALDGSVTTIAGMPAWIGGDIDGPAQQARFSVVNDLASDSAGNLYISEYNSVRRLDPAGAVNTVLSYYDVAAIAVDAHDELFVATSDICPHFGACNFQLWRVDAGRKTLVCPVDGAPYGLAVAPNGDFIVSHDDQGASRLARAGCAPDRFIGFNTGRQLRGMAMDASGNTYIADTFANTIVRVTPDDKVSTFAGQGMPGYADGPASTAQFQSPSDVAVDKAGNVYVADTGNDVVRRITPDGQVTTIAGTPGRSGLVPGPLPGVLRPSSLAIVGRDLYIGVGTAIARIRNVAP
jgi:sugar lactone lactonase YvrE